MTYIKELRWLNEKTYKQESRLRFSIASPYNQSHTNSVVFPQMLFLPSICNDPYMIQEIIQFCCDTVLSNQSLYHSGRLSTNDQAFQLKEMQQTLGILEPLTKLRLSNGIPLAGGKNSVCTRVC